MLLKNKPLKTKIVLKSFLKVIVILQMYKISINSNKI